MWHFLCIVRRILVAGVLLGIGATAPALAYKVSGSEGASAKDTVVGDLPLPAQFAISEVLGRNDEGYLAQSVPEGYRLANPAQRLSARLTRGGLEVGRGDAGFRLALTGWGYGEALGEPLPATPSAAENRIEYRRGPLTEWYVNGPLGLQQGFTLQSPPEGARGGPLTLALDLTSPASAPLTPAPELHLDRDARGVTLSHRGGGVAWRYSGLLAYDATGRELSSRMAVADGQIQLRVDDAEAVYPLVVDPFVQSAKLTASDGAAGDRFGMAVAISGDTVVVGAVSDDVGANVNQGSAYVFVRPGSGWADMTQTAKFTASDGAANDAFGRSVAIDGDTVVVGAGGVNADQGAAYVFVRPGGGWAGNVNETAKLTASDGAADDLLFGLSVAISGDTAVVGASHDDIGSNNAQGSAYVFVRPGGGWAGNLNETAKLTASDGVDGDLFGWSVSIDSDTVVAGARQDDIGANTDQGSAYVFVRPGGGWAGNLNETAKLTASVGARGDTFGESVAIDGDTVVVGADAGGGQYSCAFAPSPGAAYVFVRPGGGWAGNLNETAKLTASDAVCGDYVGSSVAIVDDMVVAGAFYDVIGANPRQGSAYVFQRPGGGWVGNVNETAKLTASGGAANDAFGFSLTMSGNTLVIGAYEGAPNDRRGSAYVFVDNSSPSSPPIPTLGQWGPWALIGLLGLVAYMRTREERA